MGTWRRLRAAAVAVSLLVQPAFAQRYDPEGEAVKGAIFGMFGQLMEHAQREMQQKQLQQQRGQAPEFKAFPFVVPPGYSTQLPPPPSLPPIYRPGREGEYRRN